MLAKSTGCVGFVRGGSVLRVVWGSGTRGAETDLQRVESDTKSGEAVGMLGYEAQKQRPQEDQLVLTQPRTNLGRGGDPSPQPSEKSLVPFNQISFSSWAHLKWVPHPDDYSHCLNSKILYRSILFRKATVMPTMGRWQRHRHTDQWGRQRVQKEFHTNTVNWVFTKVQRQFNGERIGVFFPPINDARTAGCLFAKKKQNYTHLVFDTKLTQKIKS